MRNAPTFLLDLLILIGLVPIARAQSTIPQPPFASTYSYASHTRGFHFKAPVDFIITSVQVPDESLHGQQNVAIINMGKVTSPTGTVTANELKFFRAGVPSATPIPCSVQIQKDDWVCILGACGDATNMHSSYGSGGFSSNVLGNPITLNRLVHQFNLVTSGGLGAISDGGTSSIGRVFVTVTPPTGLHANFEADVTIGAAPLKVTFTDKTFSSDPGGVTGWAWDFDGDLKVDSTIQNPIHTYPTQNKTVAYDVTLTVTDATHPQSVLTKKAYITVDPQPKADFSATPTSGAVRPGGPPLIVQFTDLSVGATSWTWDLDGDNKVDSTVQNPVFPYFNGGSYSVTLSVAGVGGNDKLTRTGYITVTDTPQLTTTFVGGTSTGTPAGCFFDIDVLAPGGIWITNLDVNCTTANQTLGLEVYVKPGTSVGSEQNAAVWTLVATGSAMSNARSTPTPVAIGDFFLPRGVHGVYIVHYVVTMSYISATAPQVYSNADISLTLGKVMSGQPFSGGLLSPRIWNGTIYYITRGWPKFGPFGAGCAGSNGVPTLAPAMGSSPRIGTTFNLALGNMPLAGGSALALLGLSKEKFGGLLPLPFDLAPLGAPGCSLLTDMILYAGVANVAGSGALPLVIPNDPVLIGGYLTNQALVLDAAANTLGLTVTNGGEMHIGS